MFFLLEELKMVCVLTALFMATTMASAIDFHPIDNNTTNMIFLEMGYVSIPRYHKTLLSKIQFTDIIDEVRLLVASIEKLESIVCGNVSDHRCSHPQSNVPHVLFKINASIEAVIHNRKRNAINMGCNYALPYSVSAELDAQQFTTKIMIFTSNLSVQKIFLNSLGDAIRIFGQRTTNGRPTVNASTDLLQLNDTVQRHILNILQVEGVINDVWDAVITAADNKFDNIAAYVNASQEIDSMRAELKPDTEFYADDNASILKTTTVDIFLTANYLEISIDVPFKDRHSQYELFQIASIPFYLNSNRTGDNDSSLLIISPLFEYIAYNTETGSTIPVTKSQLARCKSTASEKICSISRNNRPNHYYCEMNLFLNRSDSNCLIRRYPFPSSITKVMGGTFFYITHGVVHHHGLEVIDLTSNRIMHATKNTWFVLSPTQRLRYDGHMLFNGNDGSGNNSDTTIKTSPNIWRKHSISTAAMEIINRTIKPELPDTIFFGRNYAAHNTCDPSFTAPLVVLLILILPM